MPENKEEIMKKIDLEQYEPGKLTIDVRELANILEIGMNTTYELIKSKDFPKIKIGRQYRIVKSKLSKWLEDNIGNEFRTGN